MEKINTLTIGIASDHAGYELKEAVKKYLIDKGAVITDYGTGSTESCDYPEYGHLVASAVRTKYCDFGIAICGTGNGISMTVNKHPKCRCALCWNEEIAKLARQHNNANILSMPARFITEDEAKKIVDVFFSTDFEGGRHQRRIDKIDIRNAETGINFVK